MKVGIIGDGIIGTAVAATLVKNRPSVEVTLIDDARPNKTSRAGQGYLWSVHRFDDTVGLKTSMMAKRAWIDLLNDEDVSEVGLDCGLDPSSGIGRQLLQRSGSLLFSPNEDEGLRGYYQRIKCGCGSSETIAQDLEFLPDASIYNNLLRPGMFYGLYYPDDYTCNPPQIMEYLKGKFHLQTEQRTVTNLKEELTRSASSSNFDYLICCAGPWINELESVDVHPLRGLLLEAQIGETNNLGIGDPKFVPLMEYGYGTEGVHFTLSSRDDSLLIGASREAVEFSLDGLDGVQEKILQHANKFMIPGSISTITERRLGFRPACADHDSGKDRKYWIKRSETDKRIILVYGFEGVSIDLYFYLDFIVIVFNLERYYSFVNYAAKTKMTFET